MSTAFAIKTFIEVVVILLVGYAILHEDKFIAFEQKLLKKVRRKIFVYRRRKAAELRRKNGTHLKAMPTKKSDMHYSYFEYTA